jgi:hypothetical protein
MCKVLYRIAVVVMAAMVVASCQPTPPGPVAPPPPPARHFGLASCDTYFPGTPQLRDADAAHITVICEERPSWAPSVATGWFDGTAIHIWPMPGPFQVKILGHEFGHYLIAKFSDAWVSWWQYYRNIPDGHAANEDLAESVAFCVFPHPQGGDNRWEFYPNYPNDSASNTYPTTEQCNIVRGWYAQR